MELCADCTLHYQDYNLAYAVIFSCIECEDYIFLSFNFLLALFLSIYIFIQLVHLYLDHYCSHRRFFFATSIVYDYYSLSCLLYKPRSKIKDDSTLFQDKAQYWRLYQQKREGLEPYVQLSIKLRVRKVSYLISLENLQYDWDACLFCLHPSAPMLVVSEVKRLETTSRITGQDDCRQPAVSVYELDSLGNVESCKPGQAVLA